ncbi:hypothetical protein [Seonamhaeicola sp. S2-3]|uniref:hypothetical protein n=1 Tax=Seonamhaeicola sp. S2-3 TaxID=1936081 RepID=UPI0012FBF8B9|nr:hypothetical protein [Seonamhaeicola sp. S2-3]
MTVKKIRIIWVFLLALSSFNCFAQVVNEGVLFIADETNMYVENEFLNEEGAVVVNKGAVYLNVKTRKNAQVLPSGITYFKCSVNPDKNGFVFENDKIFRLSKHYNDRIIYIGEKTRKFKVTAEVKNESIIDSSVFVIRKSSSELVQTNTLKNSIYGEVELANNDYIEIWEQPFKKNQVSYKKELSLKISISSN